MIICSNVVTLACWINGFFLLQLGHCCRLPVQVVVAKRLNNGRKWSAKGRQAPLYYCTTIGLEEEIRFLFHGRHVCCYMLAHFVTLESQVLLATAGMRPQKELKDP